MESCAYCDKRATTMCHVGLPACIDHKDEGEDYLARTRRAPRLQCAIDGLARDLGISPDFVVASDHKYSCRCDKCKEWWRACGPEPESGDDGYGPFTKEEIHGST